MSIRIASRFLAVSTSVSPLETLEPEAETLTVSDDYRFEANSKEIRVRVEFSKKRLTIVEPRSAGTFLIPRSLISLKGSAVSRMSRIWSPVSDSRSSRSLPSVLVTQPIWARSLLRCARRARRPSHRPFHQDQLRLSSPRHRRESGARVRHDR